MPIIVQSASKQTNNKRYCLFANPHSHHSYFTVLALSQLYPVLLLCPPLQLQLLQGKWSRHNLSIKKPCVNEFFAQVLAFIGFFFYKLKLINERQYLGIINKCVEKLLDFNSIYIFAHYQDYINLNAEARKRIKINVCEIIISINKNSQNLFTTLQAVFSADIVVCPATSIAASLHTSGTIPKIAPYGGNKLDYRRKLHRAEHSEIGNNIAFNKTILVCARANSNRKGLDILLDSLLLLNERLGKACSTFIDVRICGSVASGQDEELLQFTVKTLNKQSRISVSAIQYPQDAYIALVSTCDLFVMPSRLEGTSPAALEALWHGVPCILSMECGVDAFIHRRHGILLDSLTSTCLADALFDMVINPKDMIQLKNNLNKDKELFSWDIYLQAYRNILSDATLPYK